MKFTVAALFAVVASAQSYGASYGYSAKPNAGYGSSAKSYGDDHGYGGYEA